MNKTISVRNGCLGVGRRYDITLTPGLVRAATTIKEINEGTYEFVVGRTAGAQELYTEETAYGELEAELVEQGKPHDEGFMNIVVNAVAKSQKFARGG